MSMEQSISLEETNKIRISLGLKPLTDDKAPGEDKEKTAEDNYAKRREQEAKDRETKKIQDRIAKVRNRRELNASLKGATLGDVDGDDDTMKWIKRSKKKEKELAQKRLKEFEDVEKAAEGEYSERDLAGLKVSHDLDDLGEGEDTILTLKDSRILDNEEDELQNVEMAEEERRKKNQDLRIKKRDYTGYDDDEFTEGAQGLMKRSILAKYDEEIEGSKSTEFRLGSSSNVSKKTKQNEEMQAQAAAVNKSLLSIDYAKNLETQDYLQEGDTKKKRPSRRAPTELDDGDGMDVDAKPVPIQRDLDANFVDDDDLQAALARSRKAKLRKTHKLTPEELAQKIAEQRLQDAEDVKEEEADTGAGLVFDETSEFVQAVGINPVVKPKQEPKEPRLSEQEDVKPSRPQALAPGDVPMDEVEAGEVRVKEEDEEDISMAMLDDIESAFKQDDDTEVKQEEEEFAVGTSNEQNFSSGMAATLSILRQQGILKPPTDDQRERERLQKQRDLWLAQQRYNIAKRELEKYQSKGAGRDQAQREYDNRLREMQERRQNIDEFNSGYKPDVNIAYHDEHGRQLTVKEAWKALSHKFHGKGSGKMKTEKRLKKIEEERKKLAMASGDTPLSMNKAFQQRQEKLGQAHFVLSVGNRGAIPQSEEFFDAQPLQKGKTDKSKKKKGGQGSQQANEGGFMTVPGPALQVISSSTPGPSSLGSSPAPRAGFSRISSMTATPYDSQPQSQGGTPVPPDRVKVAFGLGVKRKATEEAVGSPPPKRR